MKIIALDTHVTDFDGLSWSVLENLGELVKYDYSTPEEAKDRVGEAEAVIVNKVVVDQAFLGSAPKLKYVGETATGVNNIDIEACKARGITVTNVPGYSTDSVAECVFGFIHAHMSRVSENSGSEHLENYVSGPYFSSLKVPSREIAGKALGILGYGEIGKKVERLAHAYDMDVLVGALPGRDYGKQDFQNIERVSFEELLGLVDFLTLHCPLTASTEGLISVDALKKMKSSAVLINTSRGPVVDEGALAEALAEGQIAQAYLDVLAKEPPSSENPLLGLSNCIITPHIAWATREARERLVNEAALNLAAFLDGVERNLVG